MLPPRERTSPTACWQPGGAGRMPQTTRHRRPLPDPPSPLAFDPPQARIPRRIVSTASREMSIRGRLRVAMVVYGDITHDSRVQREANTLADVGHEVTLFCLGGPRGETSALDRRIQVVVRPQAPGTIVPGSPSPFRHRRRESRISSLAARVRWLTGYARNLRAWGRKVTTTPIPFDVWHVHDFAAFVAIAGSIRLRRHSSTTSTTCLSKPRHHPVSRQCCDGPSGVMSAT